MKDSKIPKFRRCVLQNFPFIEEDFDALTDYALLCKVVEYLNNVIDHQNAVDEKIDGLVEGFAELKSYVDNYFENLDVQDEINNKLEEMADSGDLASIIAQFLELSPVFAYETVSDMATAENLVAGCIAKTLGYTTAGDGKGAFYKIETLSNQVIDGNVYIAVGSTLVAHKNIEYGYADSTNPIYYGADPTGTIDSAPAINACIVANLGGAIRFSGGKYIVNSSIKTPYRTNETVNIDFGGATLYTEESLPYVLGIGYYHIDYEHMPNGNDYSAKSCYGVCENFVIDAPNATVGVMTNQNYWYPRLYNFSIFNTIIGIQLGQNKDLLWSSDAAIDNGYIQCKSYADRNTRGIVIYGHDNKITNCRIYNAFIGIEDKKGGNYFINNHIYIYGNDGDRETPEYANLYPDTIAFFANGAINDYFESVYFDSYNTAFKFTGTNFIGSFYQCFYGTNTTGFDGTVFDFSEGTIRNLSICNGMFSCEQASIGGQNYGIRLSSSQRYDVLCRGLQLHNNLCYQLTDDLLMMDTNINHTKPFGGNYTLQSANYYRMAYIPVDQYNSYIIGICGTSNPNKALARVWIGQNYSIELSNIGESGTAVSIGVKIVTIKGIRYLEVSVKTQSNTAANLGIYLEKDKSCEALGIISTVAKANLNPTLADYITTPTNHTEFAW